MQILSKRPLPRSSRGESSKPAVVRAELSRNKEGKVSSITHLFLTYAPAVTVKPCFVGACFVSGTGAHFQVSGKDVHMRSPRSVIDMRSETKAMRGSKESLALKEQSHAAGKRHPIVTRFWKFDMSGGAGSISSPVQAEHQKNDPRESNYYSDLEEKRKGLGKRQPSFIKFWKFDMSGGAGSISSPVQAEHQKNSGEAAVLYEGLAARLLEKAPAGILWTIVGVLARKTADRQVERSVIPLVQTDPKLQDKFRSIIKSLKWRIDNIIERTLEAPEPDEGYSKAETSRLVQENLKESSPALFQGFIELAREVAEAEAVGRVQQAISKFVQLNQSSAETDLGEIMKRADADGNGVITLDEAWEFITGATLSSSNSYFQDLASNWTVLKSGTTADNVREKWFSLLLAPWLKRLSDFRFLPRLQKLSEPWMEAFNRLEAVFSKFAERYSLFVDQNMNEFLRGLPDAVRESLLRVLVVATSFLPPSPEQVKEGAQEQVEDEVKDHEKGDVDEQFKRFAQRGIVVARPRARGFRLLRRYRAWKYFRKKKRRRRQSNRDRGKHV